jgi:hypothetical protein
MVPDPRFLAVVSSFVVIHVEPQMLSSIGEWMSADSNVGGDDG